MRGNGGDGFMVMMVVIMVRMILMVVKKMAILLMVGLGTVISIRNHNPFPHPK